MENKDVINYKIINVTFFVFIIYLLYKLNLLYKIKSFLLLILNKIQIDSNITNIIFVIKFITFCIKYILLFITYFVIISTYKFISIFKLYLLLNLLTKEIILENKSDIFNIKLLLGINKNTNAQTNNPINVYINITDKYLLIFSLIFL